MFLLKKVFNLRDKASSDGLEKPFLDHLEDLRSMITKMVIVLIISTGACFILKDKLMEILREPIEVVWENSQKEKLPEGISPEVWEQAKLIASHSAALTPEQKKHYLEKFHNDDLSFYGECAAYYRAALAIPDEEQRKLFIENLPDTSDRARSTTLKLLEGGPNAVVGAKNNVVYMRSLKPTETFMLSFKLAFFAGVIVAFPFLLYFLLQFIVPGLKPSERKALWPALVIGFGLFLTGVVFCYVLVLPKALDFFYTYSQNMGVENEWRIGDYITFATQFTLIFGLAFELPVVVMTLVKLNILDFPTMSSTRSYAVVSVFLVAAIITPTGDALTLCMLAVPMCILYEICIWLAYFHNKKQIEEELAESEEYQAPRLSPALGTVAAGGSDLDQGEHDPDHEHHQPYDTYEDDYDPAYFDQDPEHQNEDEGEEIDDGVIEDFDDEDAPHDPDKPFGHQQDASDQEYDPYEIDYNPGASTDTDPEDGEDKDNKPKE